MILTVDKKKKFLVTMIVIMACATAINYGLYNVLNSYLGKEGSDDEGSIYSGVNLNIIITLTIIGFVTVIMVILIPKENVKELMNRIEKPEQNNSGTVLTGSGSNTGNLGSSVGTDGYESEYEEGSDEQKLQDMVDEDLTDGDNKK